MKPTERGSTTITAPQQKIDWFPGESAAEGINSDVAFCQMVHETDYLRFGGDARAWQNNFCGLGVTDGGRRGLSFASVRIRVRAHIQHLKAYADASFVRVCRI